MPRRKRNPVRFTASIGRSAWWCRRQTSGLLCMRGCWTPNRGRWVPQPHKTSGESASSRGTVTRQASPRPRLQYCDERHRWRKTHEKLVSWEDGSDRRILRERKGTASLGLVLNCAVRRNAGSHSCLGGFLHTNPPRAAAPTTTVGTAVPAPIPRPPRAQTTLLGVCWCLGR